MTDFGFTRGLMHLPTREQVTYMTEGGELRYRWDKIDPWIERITDRGAGAVLAQVWGMHWNTLYRRRIALGMPKLPPGRPPTVNFTAYEEQVLKALQQGVTQAELARQRGVTPVAVNGTVRGIQAKVALAARQCAYCGGSGVRPCGSDGEPVCNPAPHEHVCRHCGGTSTYTANPRKP